MKYLWCCEADTLDHLLLFFSRFEKRQLFRSEVPEKAKEKHGAMLLGFEKIVEERIRNAQKMGEFDDLPGSGKPLVFEQDNLVPEELRLAYKILKNAGFLPPEIELKKEIVRTEDLLRGMEDTEEKYRALKRLNFLIMKLNAMRGCCVQNEIPQQYIEKLAARLGVSSHNSQTKEGKTKRINQ